jgi:hypothetical protein
LKKLLETTDNGQLMIKLTKLILRVSTVQPEATFKIFEVSSLVHAQLERLTRGLCVS